MNDDEMEAQMEYWKSKAKERDRLREALGEMHHLIQTRRTSVHMDGTEMFAQPLLAHLNSIARAALGEDA